MTKKRRRRPRSDLAYIAKLGWQETLRYGLLITLKWGLPVGGTAHALLELASRHLS